MVGLPGSGKTTLAKRVIAKFPFLNYVSGDMLRDFLVKSIVYFHDAVCSHINQKFNSINRIVNAYRESLVAELLQAGESVLIDRTNFTTEKRKEFIDVAKNINASVVVAIIYAKADDDTFESRLLEREQKNVGTRWREAHQERSDNFEEPLASEADNFFTYTQDNEEEILDALKQLL
jgi:adenylate kinase family enzyme